MPKQMTNEQQGAVSDMVENTSKQLRIVLGSMVKEFRERALIRDLDLSPELLVLSATQSELARLMVDGAVRTIPNNGKCLVLDLDGKTIRRPPEDEEEFEYIDVGALFTMHGKITKAMLALAMVDVIEREAKGMRAAYKMDLKIDASALEATPA